MLWNEELVFRFQIIFHEKIIIINKMGGGPFYLKFLIIIGRLG